MCKRGETKMEQPFLLPFETAGMYVRRSFTLIGRIVAVPTVSDTSTYGEVLHAQYITDL